MSEERGQRESTFDTGGLAVDLAMEEARANPSLHGHVAAFLDNQNSLINVQKHHLHEQLTQLHLDIWEKWLGVFLRLATGIVGVAAAAGVALMVWDAANSHGLLIEPFSVPPDMAQRGLTGQAVASQVLDRLTDMQTRTESARTAQSYDNNWGDDIKVEIPETGVSIGEFRRFLRDWLGHDIHITGEVYRTKAGIAVTARAGAETGATVTGSEDDLEPLVQRAAEHVYASTQPYRYGNWLDRNVLHPNTPLRIAEARAVYRGLIEDGDDTDKAWAWNGLGTLAWTQEKDQRRAIEYYNNAVAIWPDFTIGHYAVGFKHSEIGHPEQALAEFRIASRLLHRKSIPDVNPHYVPNSRAAADFSVASVLGDNAAALALARQGAQMRDTHATVNRGAFQGMAMSALVGQHDGPGERAYLRSIGSSTADGCSNRALSDAAAMEDWSAVIRWTDCADQAFRKSFPGYDADARDGSFLQPRLALAKAMLGDIAGANAVIATMAPDCYNCLQVRAKIASITGNPEQTDSWFAQAVAFAPSIPFAYHEWGQALLKRGQPDAAIEKFKLSNQKGPHFADPLEGWGEALMAKNQSHLALAKFAEAEKYAPNWGRLHLKWGEALAYSGNKAEAQKQFARAAALDLTPSEKSELARMNHV